MSPDVMIWAAAALAILGIVVRPFNWTEAVWPVAAVVLLLLSGLITPDIARIGVGKGTDVYLFLTGMMLLAEVARTEGLFDWLAALATSHAAGSARKMFLLTYIVGTVVTVFLSNDATAVVLTPAVAAAMRTAKAPSPLPFLLVCAFIANAASFVLPISNPANLVIYASHMPPLLEWLPRYLLPSALAIIATYVVLRFTQRGALRQDIATDVPIPTLTAGGKTAAAGIAATAIALLAASAMDVQLGLPTFIAGLITAVIVVIADPGQTFASKSWLLLKDISWGVLPLVAALFVLVEALDKTGVIAMIAALLQKAVTHSPSAAAWGSGIVTALVSNIANNLPVGLVAASAVASAQPPDQVTSAVLIGVDLGPNLSVTGSLATILWLTALRRDGQTVGALAFLRLGMLVMPPALLLALAGALLFR
jgi:arsenical pump membrane protein